MRARPPVAVFFALALAAGCQSLGGGAWQQAPIGSLADFRTAAVRVQFMDPTSTNAHQRTIQCQNEFTNVMIDAQLYELTGIGSAALLIDATILRAGRSNVMGPGFGDAEMEVALEVSLIDQADASVAGRLEVSGTSKSNTRSRIGIVDTSVFDDQFAKACERAAQSLVRALAAQREAH